MSEASRTATYNVHRYLRYHNVRGPPGVWRDRGRVGARAGAPSVFDYLLPTVVVVVVVVRVNSHGRARFHGYKKLIRCTVL